ERGEVPAPLVRVRSGELRAAFGQRVLEKLKPVLETARGGGGVEDEKSHFVPEAALVLAADNADRALELLAINPEFTVERHLGQSIDEPRRSMVKIALAREELFAVPVGPHAVEFLAHPPV